MLLLLGVAAAFGLMIILIKKRVPLGISLIAGGVTVGLAGFRSPQAWTETAYFAVFSRSTLELIAVIMLINILGSALRAHGSLDRLNTIMDRVFPDRRYLLAFFPAAIGMLNVPGGAILSAPLVDRAGSGIGLSADQKAAVNLFYRHFWFFVYPFYTSMIVIHGLTGVSMLEMIKLGIAPTLVGFLAGWKVCFRGWKAQAPGEKSKSRIRDLGRLIYHLSPVLVALTAALVFHVNFIIALLMGVIWIELIHRPPPETGETTAGRLKKRVWGYYTGILRPALKWQLLIIPVGINFFRSAITSSGTAKSLATFLLGLDIPVEALIFIVPLLISITTGLHLASVTISVPLFLPLMGDQGLVQPMFLLLTAASVGYWMSPLHLCLILTQEYLKASYTGIVRLMFWPTLLEGLTGVAVYILAR
jgi:hypothetical protein